MMTGRFRSRTAVAVAGSAGVAVVVAQATAYVLRVGIRGDPPQSAATTALVVVFVLTFVVVGGLVAARRPRHPVGWLLLAFGVAGATLSTGGLVHAVADDEWLRSFGAWLDAGLWHPSFPALGLLFLLFPTGRPPTPRWRWLQHTLVGAWAFLLATGPFTTPGLLLTFYPDAAPLVAGPWSEPLTWPHDGVQLAVFPLLLASVVSMVVRARRSRGVERQQLKWFAASVVLIPVVFPTSLIVFGNGSLGAPFFVLLPISCAVAVLRYRLYDIDRLVSRGVTYGLVVSLLGAVYTGGVFLLPALLPLEGDVVVAASTLLAAALFHPLRVRVRRVVDRRFNRPRYDSQREVARFAGRLRDQLDPDELTAAVGHLAATTLQPQAVGVWLRPDQAAARQPNPPREGNRREDGESRQSPAA